MPRVGCCSENSQNRSERLLQQLWVVVADGG